VLPRHQRHLISADELRQEAYSVKLQAEQAWKQHVQKVADASTVLFTEVSGLFGGSLSMKCLAEEAKWGQEETSVSQAAQTFSVVLPPLPSTSGLYIHLWRLWFLFNLEASRQCQKVILFQRADRLLFNLWPLVHICQVLYT